MLMSVFFFHLYFFVHFLFHHRKKLTIRNTAFSLCAAAEFVIYFLSILLNTSSEPIEP